MSEVNFDQIINGIKSGSIVPYIGAGGLSGSFEVDTDNPIPADSDSLIYAINNGKPMAPRLMYEFPRAAMDVELKRGRVALERALDEVYKNKLWTRAPLHDWLATIKPDYVIDINRDTQLQDSYVHTPHILIRGVARIAGTDYRFKIHTYDGQEYSSTEVDQKDVNWELPVLFKPMGSPLPDSNYISSDADYVDYISELMGGFAIPDYLKSYRKDKQYFFIGLSMSRDTERMVMSDMIYAAGKPAGWCLLPQPTNKERKFCAKQNIEIIEKSVDDFLNEIGYKAEATAMEAAL